jgi:hypothetical protein
MFMNIREVPFLSNRLDDTPIIGLVGLRPCRKSHYDLEKGNGSFELLQKATTRYLILKPPLLIFVKEPSQREP